MTRKRTDLDNYSQTLVVPSNNITSARPGTTNGRWEHYVSGSHPDGNIS